MNRHVERLALFQSSGKRLLPPPPILDLDPIIPPYEKFGEEGHLYIVKPPQEPGEGVFKVGSTTQLLKRMYWYEPGTELLFSIYVPEKLRIMERQRTQQRPELCTSEMTGILYRILGRRH